MSLDLKPEIESQVIARAQAAGTSASDYIANLLRENNPYQSNAGTPAKGGQLSRSPATRDTTKRKRPSALGKYAFVAGGSEEFAREKQAEIEREDRAR
jgi:hypothetical protein